MHFACRSFIGKPTSTTWSQYWENEPDDLSIVTDKGHLFGLLSFTSLSAGDSISTLGHQYIDQLSQHYFSSESQDIVSTLKSVLLELVDQNSQTKFNTILLAISHHGHVYFALYGQGQVILNRQDKVTQLLLSSDQTVNHTSGLVQSGDRFLMVSQDFLDSITWLKIKEILSDQSLQSVEESFLSCLYSHSESQSMAGVLVQIHTDEADPAIITQTPAPAVLETTTSSSFPPPPLANPAPPSFNPPKPKRKLFANLFKPRGIFLDHYQSQQLGKRKKINLLVALLLLTALGFSAFYGFRKNQAARIETQYQTLKQDLDKKITDASAIKNLDLEAALQLARQAETIHGQMALLQIHTTELATYQQTIKNILSQTGSSTDFAPQQYYDTLNITDNPSYNHMILSDNQLILLDSSKGRLDAVEIGAKSIKNLLSDSSLKTASHLLSIGGQTYLVSSESVLQVGKTQTTKKADLTKVDPAINVVDAQSWNGSLYLLDATASTIWKLTPNSAGFGSPQNWIKDLKNFTGTPTSLAINGRIWVLTQDGSLTPYTRGVAEAFDNPVDTKLTSADHLATTLATDILAYTEADNIVYVIKKTGQAISKYNLGTKKVHDLVIDEQNSQLFILATDQKIYRISLPSP